MKFEIFLESDWYERGDILKISDTIGKAKVLSKPKRKWYHKLLQWITFGWFRAKYTHTIRLM